MSRAATAVSGKSHLLQYKKPLKRKKIVSSIRRNWDLYLLIAPVVIFFIVFHYFPLYGLQIAFKNFVAVKGIMGSPWVGFDNFERFFNSYFFWRLLGNTLGISVYQLLAGFPIPILLALLMNELRNKAFKKTIQMVTYAPHFISLVVLVGMMYTFLAPDTGIVNNIIKSMGLEPVQFMTEERWFKSLYVWSGVWQQAGWSSIIYMAALAGVDIQQYEAAYIDGATKLQRLRYITIPGIIPTAVMMFILESGRVMNVGFEKVYLMQNPLNIGTADVISTFVYSSGILKGEYSFSSAIGLFNNVINITLVLMVNKISKKVSETGLW